MNDENLPTAPRDYFAGKKSSALALIEMRREILARVDVIQNWIDIANGVMPAKWDKAFNTKEDGTRSDAPVKLTLEHTLKANEVLIKRILPEYRQVELSSSDAGGAGTSFEENREKLFAAIESAVSARGGVMRPDGTFTLPPRMIEGAVVEHKSEEADDHKSEEE